jgi:hypothetical protein
MNQCYEAAFEPKNKNKSVKVDLKFDARDIYGMIKEGGLAYICGKHRESTAQM